MTTEDQERYHRAAHAMQSGVALEMTQGSRAHEPKHLRVGVNSAMVTDEAIASLLIAKGVFTLDEYQASVADAMEREQQRFETTLGVKLV